MSFAARLVEMLLGEDIQSKMPHLLRQFPEFDQAKIEQIAEIDPTPTKIYITWLLKQVRQGSINLDEDAEEMREALALFDQVKRRGTWQSERDINRYQQAGDLYQALEPVKAERAEKANNSGRLLGRSGDLAIYALRSVAETMTASANTSWCVKREKYAEDYLSKGNLYVVTKNNKPYVLTHPATSQARDTHDATITAEMAEEIAPVVKLIDPSEWKPIEDTTDAVRQVHMNRRMKLFNRVKGDFIRDRGEKAWQKAEARFYRDIVEDPFPEWQSEKTYNLGSSRQYGLAALYRLVAPGQLKAFDNRAASWP